MNCYNCENNRRVYLADCLGCAIRLVKSARPGRKQQDAMLAYIERNRRFTREQVIEAINADAAIS